MAYQSTGKYGTDDFDMQTIGNFLSCACRGDRVGLNLMLRDGTSPNVQDYDNRTALHLAASEGHASIVELLLHYKADVNLEDRWHRTPLTDARLYGHRDICRILEVNGGKHSVMNSPMVISFLFLNLFIMKKMQRNLWLFRNMFLPTLRRVLSANDNTHLRELRHPNIVQFLGSIQHDGQMILITEHLSRMVEGKYIPKMRHLKSVDFEMKFNSKCPARIQQLIKRCTSDILSRPDFSGIIDTLEEVSLSLGKPSCVC
ncbi:hypothetical protein Ccrd_005529 [Cynara cardunculus var. scolymus]|uniref:Uncharacterized protein n=1 Tax=Cynara cardunculus var. scolymus TaxID=59895 RepID=A0A103XKM4_CYNCS|nr:hypothetical protein Ccrd_005529 [Cynara cardunculus var. scolymus]